VSDPPAVEAAFAEVRERFGPVLVLVNNAGVAADGLTIRMSSEDWDTVLATNLTGAFNCTRRALDDMLSARWGRIVNVSSVVATRANPGQANYVAAKAGLLGFTRTVAREMARKGITSNAITPGVIETDMTADLSGGLSEAVPAGRVGRPEEVAAAAAFLISDDAAYINGATLSVDGGLGA
jgi:3-oxoacyl-[acyl-carrier protein] reductase